VVTIGRLATGGEQTVQVPVQVSTDVDRHERLSSVAAIHSATALPIFTNWVSSRVSH